MHLLSLLSRFRSALIFYTLCFFLVIGQVKSSFAQQDTTYAFKLMDSVLVLKPNDPAKAKLLCSQALTIFEAELELTDTLLIHPYRTFGNILEDLSRFKESLKYHQKSLDVYQNGEISNPFTLGSIYNNLGNVYSSLGKHQLSLDYLHKSENQFNLRETNKFKERRSRVLSNLGITYRNIQQVEKSLKYYREAIKLNHEVSDTSTIYTAILYVNLGVSLGDVGLFQEAIESHTAAKTIIEKLMGPNHVYVGICYNNLGLVANYKGDVQLSKLYYTKAMEIARSNKSNLEGLAIAYNNLGSVHRKLGDFDKALDFYHKSKNINIQVFSEDHQKIGDYYGNIANIYMSQGKYESAKLNHIKSIDIFENILGQNALSVAEVYSNLALLEYNLGETGMGINYIKKSIELALKTYEEDNIFLAKKYSILGTLYNKAGIYPEAIKEFQTSEKIYKKNKLENHPELAALYADLAKAYIINHDAHTGRSVAQKALDILEFDLSANEFSTRALVFNEPSTNTLGSLRLLYQQNINEERVEYRDSLLLVNRHIIAIQEYKIQNSIDPENKRIHLKEAKKQYGLAIRDYLNLDLPGMAFALSDKMKSRTLNTSIQKSELAVNFNIPDSLVNQEIQLLSEINKHQNNLHQIDFLSPEADSIYKVEFNKLFTLKQRREIYYDNIKKDYLEYWHQLYEPKSLQIEEIQNKLTAAQSYLQYFVQNDSTLIAFLINKNDSYTKIIDFENSLVESILLLKQKVSDNQSKEDIHNLSATLYSKLIDPFDKYLQFELFITPDEILSLLPFEILRKDDKYLIEDHCISYHYSTQLWELMENKKFEKKKGLLALAPSFDDFNEEETMDELMRLRASVGPLLYNQEEARMVAELWGGEYLSPEKSSLEEFLAKAPQYEILHLATHGKADDRKGEYSYLLLKSTGDTVVQKLYVKDLYGLNLSNQLVVLSACETGVGEVQQGEGIMSMAHGFAMAGSQSIVPTLWSINDKSSAQIIINFFQNLKKGEKKNEALRNAKLSFLENNPDTSPFYWAPFIAIGDINPIQKEFSYLNYLFIGIGIILFVLAILFVRKNQSQHTV